MPRLTRSRSSRSSTERKGPRLVLSVMGKEGHGKTDLSLTAPQPIACASVDPNTQAVIEKKFKADIEDIDPEKLTFLHVPYPAVGFEDDEDVVMAQAKDAWDQLLAFLTPIIRGTADPMPRSVILDTGTEFNELNILYGFGRTDKIAPKVRMIRMGEVNNRFKGIFRGLENAGVHVIVPHRCREIWETETIKHGPKKGEEKDVPTGKYERVGFKQMGNICNTEVLAKFDQNREGKLVQKFGVEITRSTIRPSLIGTEYWGKDEETGIRMPSFQWIAHSMYPSTSLEDWL